MKHGNQFNDLAQSFTGGAPTRQELIYEYVFADWNAARIALEPRRGGRANRSSVELAGGGR